MKHPATYNAETFVQLKNPTKDWYTFAGWSPNSIIPTWTIGNKTFVANWEANKYQISYDLAGWTVNGINPSNYTYGVWVASFTAPTKKWYTFAGWTDENDDPISSISNSAMWDKTLTANWTANEVEYYVYYYEGSNILWVEIRTADAGTTPTLTAASYKTFEGYTKPTASTICPEIEEGKICKVEWYSKTSYSLTFKNGDTVVKTTSIAYDTEITSTYIPTAPTADGKTFDGWDKAIPERMPAKDVTLNAKWSNNQYKITYTNTKWVEHANAGSYNFGDAFTFTALSKDGYTFNGWTPAGITATDKADKTVTANWTADSYTISFEWTTKADQTYTIETETFTIGALADKEGYKFVWWTGDGYSIPVKEIKIQKGSMWDKEFTANWEPINYTITYELTGWTNNAGNPSSYTITTATITLAAPTKEGYTFKEWQDGNGTKVTTIPTWSHENITLTAVWEDAESYTITYEWMEGATNHADNPSTYTVNDLVVLKNPIREGYTFAGWEEWNIIERGSTGNKTFTATWTKNQYKIRYNLNGWVNGENPWGYDVTTATITLDDPIREGYTFAGWKDENNNTVTQIAVWSTGDKEFTANWTATEYDITYVLDGWTNNASNPDTYTVEDTILFLAPTKSGKTFLGWRIGESTTVYPTLVITHSTWDKTLTAVWWEDSYTITYKLDGWVNNDANPSSYTHGTAVTLQDPTKRGYDFAGWKLGNETVTSIPADATWDKELTATWTVVNYTINYTLNGWTNNADNPSSYNVNSNDIVLKNPSKNGYTFKWWMRRVFSSLSPRTSNKCHAMASPSRSSSLASHTTSALSASALSFLTCSSLSSGIS